MILETIAKPIAFLSFQQVKKVERLLGFRLILNQDGNKWIDGTMIFDMTPVWKKYGFDATGVNYFTIGKVSNGISSRFDSNSRYYQAWLGGYIVRFFKSRKWTIDDHFHLGEADQKNWLSIYGVKKPVADINFDKVIKHGTFNIGNYKGTLYQGGGDSNTDVGNKTNKSYLSLLWAGGAYFFNKSNSKLNLTHSAFIPNWKEKVLLDSYQVIHLEGYVAIIEIDDKTKAILYANGCSFTDKNGKKIDTFKQLQLELKDCLKKFRIEKVS
jgi:hypothetical protein